MTRQGGGPARASVGVVLAVVLAGLGFVLVASHTTPSGYHPKAPAGHYSVGPAPSATTPPARASSAPAREPRVGAEKYPALALIAVEVLALVALVVLLLGWLRGLRIRRRSRTSVPVAGPAQTLARSLATAADEGLAELTGDDTDGPVDEVIIACWLRLRDAAVTAGVEPHAADSPADFVARVRSEARVRPEAIERLADLYREARFSRHEMTSADRTAAVQALLAIRADLIAEAQHA